MLAPYLFIKAKRNCPQLSTECPGCIFLPRHTVWGPRTHPPFIVWCSSVQEHKVLLTGTPLQNSVEELFSLLNFLEPSQFPSETAFLEEFGDLKTEEQVNRGLKE